MVSSCSIRRVSRGFCFQSSGKLFRRKIRLISRPRYLRNGLRREFCRCDVAAEIFCWILCPFRFTPPPPAFREFMKPERLARSAERRKHSCKGIVGTRYGNVRNMQKCSDITIGKQCKLYTISRCCKNSNDSIFCVTRLLPVPRHSG